MPAAKKVVVPTLEEYKAQVRETALRVARDQGWCRDGLNDELKKLGLAPAETEYRVVTEVEFVVEGGTKKAAAALIHAVINDLKNLDFDGVVVRGALYGSYSVSDVEYDIEQR